MEKEIFAGAVAPLLAWYRKEGRPLPWREEVTPYHVWISEIMLQQTRIETVIPYYHRFLRTFPDIEALAGADEETLLKCWEGLGYYSRARNLQKAARLVMERFGGVLPRTPEELRRLPGIGDYTAGAIASIANGLPAPAVDGNVLRVTARLLADPTDILLPAVRRRVSAWLSEIYPRDPEDAAAMTQALMELGEVICTPGTSPRCDVCPLASLCESKKAGLTEKIPYRAPLKERTTEERTLLLPVFSDLVAICKRPPEGLLGGMWEFPAFPGFRDEDEAGKAARTLGLSVKAVSPAPTARHIFTHLEWHMRAFLILCDAPAANDGILFVPREELKGKYPLPSAFRRYRQFLLERETR